MQRRRLNRLFADHLAAGLVSLVDHQAIVGVARVHKFVYIFGGE
jgi:hypothetical protein